MASYNKKNATKALATAASDPDFHLTQTQLDDEIAVQKYDQLIMLRYNPPVKKSDHRSHSTEGFQHGWFDGKLKPKSTKDPGRIVYGIQQDWAEWTFHKSYLNVAKRKHGIWIEVIPGKRNHEPDWETQPTRKCRRMTKAMRFDQEGRCPLVFRQGPFSHTCVAKSLASALWWASKYSAAICLNEHADRIAMSVDWLAIVKAIMLKCCPEWATGRWWRPASFYTFDFATLDKCFPVLAILQGSDGGTAHCVTIYNGYIFDACEVYALLLTKRNLDRCVGSNCTYVNVHQAWEFRKKI